MRGGAGGKNLGSWQYVAYALVDCKCDHRGVALCCASEVVAMVVG